MKERVSGHQYGGPNGTLCLEWGPDNWRKDVTAAQMLLSAYRLFDTENPLWSNRPEIPVVAPSRHQLTIGQQTRGQWSRWHESRSLVGFFAAQPKDAIGSFRFSFRKVGENWIALIHEVTPLGGAVWKDQVPTTLPGATQQNFMVAHGSKRIWRLEKSETRTN